MNLSICMRPAQTVVADGIRRLMGRTLHAPPEATQQTHDTQ